MMIDDRRTLAFVADCHRFWWTSCQYLGGSRTASKKTSHKNNTNVTKSSKKKTEKSSGDCDRGSFFHSPSPRSIVPHLPTRRPWPPRAPHGIRPRGPPAGSVREGPGRHGPVDGQKWDASVWGSICSTRSLFRTFRWFGYRLGVSTSAQWMMGPGCRTTSISKIIVISSCGSFLLQVRTDKLRV